MGAAPQPTPHPHPAASVVQEAPAAGRASGGALSLAPASFDPGLSTTLTGYQKFVVAVLAFLQFTIILDFMILSPLGAMVMPALDISPKQFGFVVSAYAFSAGASGILASGFADRFDRKKLLLFFYVGFVAGTLLCALAPTYEFLMFARIVTGLFGGVIGSIAFAITTDLFPMHMRGRVMGYMQTAFAASQVLGIPLGLAMSKSWGWHAPFFLIVGLSAAVGVLIFAFLKPIDGHLKLQSKGSHNPFTHLWATLSNRRYIQAFAAMGLLATGGFMLMPFGSAFSVNNLGISLEQLPYVYLLTGVSTLFMGPLIGRFTDSVGKFKTFMLGSALMCLLVFIYTNLGHTPLWLVVVVNAVMFVGIMARMISSQALMSAIPGPADRGAFMSISASLSQIAGGVAAAAAGLIVSEASDGAILHFDTLGYVVIGANLVTMFMIHRIRGMTPGGVQAAPQGMGH